MRGEIQRSCCLSFSDEIPFSRTEVEELTQDLSEQGINFLYRQREKEAAAERKRGRSVIAKILTKKSRKTVNPLPNGDYDVGNVTLWSERGLL